MPHVAHLAYLALGSNLGDRKAHLAAARDAINALPESAIEQSSSLYETKAWGTSNTQPDYLNAVIAVATTLSPLALWHYTSSIEHAHGRSRNGEKNSARTLDIDLLLVDDMVMNTPNLVLPHPRMHKRAFVLRPLLDVAPDISIPGHGPVARLLDQLSDHATTRLNGEV